MVPFGQNLTDACVPFVSQGNSPRGGGESGVFFTCSGAPLRCATQLVERMFCALSSREFPHILEGTARVLSERFPRLCQQGGTYIVKTGPEQYTDLHCLKSSGRLATNEYPPPVGAYQKNLEGMEITVTCARDINGQECGESLPLAMLLEHQRTVCPIRVRPYIIPTSESTCDADSSNGSGDEMDEQYQQGLLTDYEALQLNQMIRDQEATLMEADPEYSPAIARQIAKACDSEPCNYSGTLCWTISEYSRKKFEAETGQLTMLASQPFYTRTGYKLCAKLYLAGDSRCSEMTSQNSDTSDSVSAQPFKVRCFDPSVSFRVSEIEEIVKGQFQDYEKKSADKDRFSIGFAIMKTDHDDNLNWPFQEKVTISLLDQRSRNGSNHITRSIFGRACHNCDKPQSAMNPGLGFPDFLEGKRMDEGFIANDSLVIQVEVESLERKYLRAERMLPMAGAERFTASSTAYK